jgi:hypothetical protein
MMVFFPTPHLISQHPAIFLPQRQVEIRTAFAQTFLPNRDEVADRYPKNGVT